MDAETRMPKRGEGWRHYKSNKIYEIVGTGYDEATGNAIVVYTDYDWGLAQAPALWSRSLEVFMGMTETRERRFTFDRAAPSKDLVVTDEIERLRLEISVLRNYGNKGCTAMADEALEQKRTTGKGPWED